MVQSRDNHLARSNLSNEHLFRLWQNEGITGKTLAESPDFATLCNFKFDQPGDAFHGRTLAADGAMYCFSFPFGASTEEGRQSVGFIIHVENGLVCELEELYVQIPN